MNQNNAKRLIESVANGASPEQLINEVVEVTQLNTLYFTRTSINEIYAYGTERLKNGGLSGYVVTRQLGKKNPEKAKKTSLSMYHGFRSVKDISEVDPSVIQRFSEVGIKIN